MKTSFIFYFDNSRKEFCRKYRFDLEFINNIEFEKCLDWTENSDDILEFIQEMNGLGTHEVNYDPNKDFYGFESGEVSPKNYIKVMECWRDFFLDHNIECGDIFEIIDDRSIVESVY